MQTQIRQSRNVEPLRGPTQTYLSGLAPSSRATMRHRLDVVAQLLDPRADGATFPWHTLTYRDATHVRSSLAERYSYRTVNGFLVAVKSVLRESHKHGLMTTESYHRATDFKLLKGQAVLAGRLIHADEFAELFASVAADHSPSGVRDLALLGTYRSTGMRRSELLGLRREDYRAPIFKVLGKGNKEREVGAADWLAEPMDAWLRVRGASDGALFCKIHARGAVDRNRGHMTPTAVNFILKRRLQAAGVAPFTIHDMRRTLISELLDAGADLGAVQKQAGHVRADTTLAYDRRPLAQVRRAVQLIPSPLG